MALSHWNSCQQCIKMDCLYSGSAFRLFYASQILLLLIAIQHHVCFAFWLTSNRSLLTYSLNYPIYNWNLPSTFWIGNYNDFSFSFRSNWDVTGVPRRNKTSSPWCTIAVFSFVLIPGAQLICFSCTERFWYMILTCKRISRNWI